MEKINYNNIFKNIINEVRFVEKKPRLLLHACCGPCFTWPYERLKDYFDITIIYNNSNIYPETEYKRRLNELKQFIKSNNLKIKVVEAPYDNTTYNNKVLSQYKDYPEGSLRCYKCYESRLSFGYEYAYKNGFDFYGTVMSISRYKNSQYINQIGEELNKKYPSVKWLYADFKKEDGYQKSLEIVKKEKMYFQEYCGCVYSYEKYQEKLKKIAEK